MEKFGEGLCALLLLLYFAHVARCDSRCIAQFGTCKYKSSGCPGGSFTRGLCNGPYDRQCCVPGGGSGGSGSGSAGSCSGVSIVSRAGWRARSPKSTSYMSTPVSLVFIHHTAGSTCSSSSSCARVARETQNFHMNSRGYSDVGYNFLVGGDGKIYEGRGWNRVGAHTLGFNSRAIAISFMGNFMKQSPTSSAINAAKNLIACGVREGKIRSSYKLYGHRQAGSTSCPGDRLYRIIQSWPRYTSGRA
ncbi:hypothetical protein BaRGS_00028571 [Batillaria attramentaria]|uniref:Peptidoglycan-recognition protein n=1 Tax=Batillaria attramentaria TaxID=370345 RepID=A0ABD0JYQ6_9CAEN